MKYANQIPETPVLRAELRKAPAGMDSNRKAWRWAVVDCPDKSSGWAQAGLSAVEADAVDRVIETKLSEALCSVARASCNPSLRPPRARVHIRRTQTTITMWFARAGGRAFKRTSNDVARERAQRRQRR